ALHHEAGRCGCGLITCRPRGKAPVPDAAHHLNGADIDGPSVRDPDDAACHQHKDLDRRLAAGGELRLPEIELVAGHDGHYLAAAKGGSVIDDAPSLADNRDHADTIPRLLLGEIALAVHARYRDDGDDDAERDQ